MWTCTQTFGPQGMTCSAGLEQHSPSYLCLGWMYPASQRRLETACTPKHISGRECWIAISPGWAAAEAGPWHRRQVAPLALLKARWSQHDGLYLEAAVAPPCRVEPKSVLRCCIFSGQMDSIRPLGVHRWRGFGRGDGPGLLDPGWVVTGLARRAAAAASKGSSSSDVRRPPRDFYSVSDDLKIFADLNPNACWGFTGMPSEILCFLPACESCPRGTARAFLSPRAWEQRVVPTLLHRETGTLVWSTYLRYEKLASKSLPCRLALRRACLSPRKA